MAAAYLKAAAMRRRININNEKLAAARNRKKTSGVSINRKLEEYRRNIERSNA